MARQHKPDPWQEDYERQKAAGFPRQPQPPARPAARGPRRPATPAPISPAKQFLGNWQPWGIGTFGLGILLVIVAIVLHDHYALPNAACRSGLGQLGQEFSGTLYYDCSAAGAAEGAVGWLVFLGIAALLTGGGKMLLALVGAAAVTKQEAAQPGPATPGTGESAVPGSGQPGPAQPPVADGTR